MVIKDSQKYLFEMSKVEFHQNVFSDLLVQKWTEITFIEPHKMIVLFGQYFSPSSLVMYYR